MTMHMRIVIERDRCVGAGMCVAAAPEIFDQDEDNGLVDLLSEVPPARLHAAARDAADICPARAIRIADA